MSNLISLPFIFRITDKSLPMQLSQFYNLKYFLSEFAKNKDYIVLEKLFNAYFLWYQFFSRAHNYLKK